MKERNPSLLTTATDAQSTHPAENTRTVLWEGKDPVVPSQMCSLVLVSINIKTLILNTVYQIFLIKFLVKITI